MPPLCGTKRQPWDGVSGRRFFYDPSCVLPSVMPVLVVGSGGPELYWGRERGHSWRSRSSHWDAGTDLSDVLADEACQHLVLHRTERFFCGSEF